jgi:hypothetical protein
MMPYAVGVICREGESRGCGIRAGGIELDEAAAVSTPARRRETNAAR